MIPSEPSGSGVVSEGLSPRWLYAALVGDILWALFLVAVGWKILLDDEPSVGLRIACFLLIGHVFNAPVKRVVPLVRAIQARRRAG